MVMGNKENKSKEICLSKVKYDNKESATKSYQRYKRTMKRSRGRRFDKIKHEQIPYKCEYCDGWHLKRIK